MDARWRKVERVCQSPIQHDCYGYIRKCPVCKRRVCWGDGGADRYDLAVPGICDTCASLMHPHSWLWSKSTKRSLTATLRLLHFAATLSPRPCPRFTENT